MRSLRCGHFAHPLVEILGRKIGACVPRNRVQLRVNSSRRRHSKTRGNQFLTARRQVAQYPRTNHRARPPRAITRRLQPMSRAASIAIKAVSMSVVAVVLILPTSATADNLKCGAGTVKVKNVCLPNYAVICGNGTQLVGGQCLPAPKQPV